MFHELAINCRNFSFSKKGRSNCAGRRISIRKGGEAMGPLAGSVVTCAYEANGNITEYVSGSGEILSHNDYSAFGRELIKTGSDDFTHRFSTKPYCRKTGFIEYQLRKYKPWCGRWMNRDLIESRNLYNYLFNSSFLYYEYLGMFGNPVIGPGGTTWGPSSPYDPGGPFSPDVPWYDNLPDCPCSIPVDSSGCPDSNGAGDGWTSPVETGHAGGTWEIRSDPVASGAGQQCVYDSAGNLINQGPGAGTPDRMAPSPNKIKDDLWNLNVANLKKTAKHILADGWQFMFGTEFDHLTHPPNKGQDANGNPCPNNDGSANPPIDSNSKCCNN